MFKFLHSQYMLKIGVSEKSNGCSYPSSFHLNLSYWFTCITEHIYPYSWQLITEEQLLRPIHHCIEERHKASPGVEITGPSSHILCRNSLIICVWKKCICRQSHIRSPPHMHLFPDQSIPWSSMKSSSERTQIVDNKATLFFYLYFSILCTSHLSTEMKIWLFWWWISRQLRYSLGPGPFLTPEMPRPADPLISAAEGKLLPPATDTIHTLLSRWHRGKGHLGLDRKCVGLNLKAFRVQ